MSAIHLRRGLISRIYRELKNESQTKQNIRPIQKMDLNLNTVLKRRKKCLRNTSEKCPSSLSN